jgi:hypothetical protein
MVQKGPGDPKTSVGDLCRYLGVTRQSLQPQDGRASCARRGRSR